MKKKTKIIIIVSVTAAVIAAIVGAVLLINHELKKSYEPYSYSLADGSTVKSEGGNEVYHTLFDEYTISSTVRDYFSNSLSKRHYNGISYEETYITAKWCYIEKYAFEKNGYIAYYCYVPAEDEEQSGENTDNIRTVKLFDKDFKISDMYAGLYDCNNEKEMRFDTFEELLKYAEDNSINLGTVYKITRFGVSEYKAEN